MGEVVEDRDSWSWRDLNSEREQNSATAATLLSATTDAMDIIIII
jgi:hypothetical protein